MAPDKVEQSARARHIARVAARLFAGRGYDATPVRAIAEAAGVTKPTLYYHFGSKEGLAQALLTVPMARLEATLRGILERAGAPVDRLGELVEAHFAFCREDPDRVRFLYALFFGPLGSGLATELGRFSRAMEETLARAVGRLAAEGRLDSVRVEACATALRGLIVIHTMDYLYRGGGLGPELAQRLVSDLLRGFGRPEAGRRDPAD
ncbi:MAG TPA: TetR/AcrR family transcriptional regulator [Isosphaeraceae bacterium]